MFGIICGRKRRSITKLAIFLLIPLILYIFVYYDIVRRLGNSSKGRRVPLHLVKFEEHNDNTTPTTTAQRVAARKGSTAAPLLKPKCELPNRVFDGVPWPNCYDKIAWMKNGWKNDPCYANHGVSDDICSIIEYLSTIERHCPQTRPYYGELEPLYHKGEKATVRKSFDHLYNELADIGDYAWIKARIRSLEKLWKISADDVFQDARDRNKKRIHLHLGLMRLGLGQEANKGGPLGELVQWSDLIAALYVMGHDIVLTKNKQEVSFVYDDYLNRWNLDCPTPSINHTNNVPFDLIYTDITGYKEMQQVIKGNKFDLIRCRLRIVDSFGTEADFNDARYAKAKKLKTSQYSGLNLNLQQFNTMFPHSPDNTFLGFVIEDPSSAAGLNFTVTRDIALVYGKVESFWAGKEHYIDIIKEYVSEVHATVQEPKNLAPYIVNHGVLPIMDLFKLLHRARIFVGLGFPFEGPAPLEAIQQGAVFLNPRFLTPISSENHEFYKAKPTRRKITSQNPYAEMHIGKPHAYTVDINNETALRQALREIMSSPEPGKYTAQEFSAKGMLERVSVQVEKQQFCVTIPYTSTKDTKYSGMWWPPLSALKVVVARRTGTQSCNDVCGSAGLVCEPTFFSVVNRKEAFELPGVDLTCKNIRFPETPELDFPAYDPSNQTCYFQTNGLLFSCAGNYAKKQRLCPCRAFIKGQTIK